MIERDSTAKLTPRKFHEYRDALVGLGVDVETARKRAAELRLLQIHKSKSRGKLIIEHNKANHGASTIQTAITHIDLYIRHGVASCLEGVRQHEERTRPRTLVEVPIEITVFDE